MYMCNECGKNFTRSDNLRRHQRDSCTLMHYGGPSTENDSEASTPKRMRLNPPAPPVMQTCQCCNLTILSDQMNVHRRTLHHRTNACVHYGEGVKIVGTAFKCRIVSYRVDSQNHHMDYNTFFNELKQKVLKLLEEVLVIHKIVKVNMEVFGRYNLQTKEYCDVKAFNSSNQVIDQSNDLNVVYNNFADSLTAQAMEFQHRDSGWTIEKILYLEVNVNKFSPLGGSSYIKLPKFIESKKSVVNVVNQDHYCFAWAVTSALYPASARVCELSSYPHFSTVLNVAGMEFPVKLKDIPKFEVMNNCSINVYGLENTFKNGKIEYEVVGPLHYSKSRLNSHVNLLNITDESGNSHYCWIKDLSRLVSSQISAHHHKKYFCDGCLLYFSDERALLRHQLNDCNHISTTTPNTNLRIDKFGKCVPENILKFENFEKQLKVPFVVYADFESILKPVHTNEPNPAHSFTNKTYLHEPYAFSYIIKCSFDDSISKFVLYRGADAAKVFVSNLEADVTNIYHKYLKNVVPMSPLTAEEEHDFNIATTCGICGNKFEEGDIKVRDHCHLTGKKRNGATHSICNLNFKLPEFIPIIFHNLSGYDCHLFIKELCTDKNKVDVIAQTKEKYVSFTKHLFMENTLYRNGQIKKKYLKLRFVDSFKFLAASLQELGDNLDEKHFVETKKYFPENDKFQLMRQKGVFPYNFIDCLDKLNYSSIPSKLDFYDKLNEKHISDEDYDRVKQVWGMFNCRDLGEYSDIYLKSDVLLLCDIFENFRNMSLGTYKLDPAHYFTSPGLSWDAMLKFTGVELELLTDIDMVHFFQNGIRGGVSQCSERKHIANNQFLPNYNPNEPSSFIMYLDATNLYGHSMCQSLPVDGFTWLTADEISQLDINSIPDDGCQGYILEVDVHYPIELHDLHSDLPFLVESIIPPGSKSKIPKLIPNLNDKKKYIVHYRNLKQAVRNGLMVMRTHRILRFNQSPWLKKYIDLNTTLRNNAKNKFEKNYFKLNVNSIYGKTMENVNNRRDIRIVTHWESIRRGMGANALIARPNFKTLSIFSEDFVAIHMGRVKVCYNKPLYLGFCILDMSKTVIYDFFYDVIKKHYGSQASLLYTDTDSLILKIMTDNFYDFMSENIDKFDTSNYVMNNKFNVPVTKSILGKMKDELPSDPIISFHGTGAKAYHVQSVSDEIKKAKGIKKSVIRNQISVDDYIKIVETGGTILRKMNIFRSDLHEVYTLMCNKVALSHKDDKRFIIPNTTKTLPWGHNDIEFYQTSPNQNFRIFLEVLKDESNVGNGKLDLLIKLLEEQLTN
ncbi:uncharacterized protein [Leptinotarsa decemlineata]|uniref:uncharacterized protein n=1 Tax=Leptinotarsa decemlineata TaxID=7539 RepID=UPI003D30D2C6